MALYVSTFFASLLAQISINAQSPLIIGASAGILTGAMVGVVVWPLLIENDLAGRVLVGALIGGVIRLALELIGLGTAFGNVFSDVLGNALTPGGVQINPGILDSLWGVVVTATFGAIVVAIISSPRNALMGGLIGLVVGALAGAVVTYAFITWSIPAQPVFFYMMVGLISLVTLVLFPGRR